MKIIFNLSLLLCCFSAFAQKETYLLIGTYTGGKSEGIYVYKFNTENADNSFVSAVKSSNPSFLAVSPDQKFVYAVNENAAGGISSFSFDKKKGILTQLNSRPSGGKDPCYVSLDSSGRWLFVGNYSSGNLGLLPVREDGKIDPLKQVIQHTGSGPDTARQKSPHVHSTSLSADQKYLYVADLGIDRVMTYTFDAQRGTLGGGPAFAASEPGSGPRHIAFDPTNSFAYLMEEMSETVVVYKIEDGALKSKQRVSALPEDFKGFKSGADIHVSPDGNFLYCSNRGDASSISIFSIDKPNGEIKLIGQQSTFGKTPRNFNFDPSGNFLLVANQDTDEIVLFKINRQTGLLTDLNKKIQVPSPVCIKWIK